MCLKVLETAAQQGPEAVARYAVMHAQKKFKMRECGEAAAVLAQYGMAPDPALFDLYRGIALEVLGTGP